MLSKYLVVLFLVFIILNPFLSGKNNNSKDSCASFVINPLQDIAISSNTGDKPQSKVWFHDETWWAVLPNMDGTKLWQLVGSKWVNVLHLSDSSNIRADTRAIGNVTQILLYQGWNSQLVSVEYDDKNKKYVPWNLRPYAISIQLEKAGETATIDIDTSGRMWLASDDETKIHVRWSDSPYDNWSEPIVIATGISADDICAISTFPDGSTGVLWSNQKTKRFGFRKHTQGTNPKIWTADEIPASSSSILLEGGMADDHLNIAVASDGTLYAAVKTSYDTKGYPLIALLVRRPSGNWDIPYTIDDEGSRGIVLLNEEENSLMIIYSSYRDHRIVFKISNTENISFGERSTLMSFNANNVTSTKQKYRNEVVILASEESTSKSVQLRFNKVTK